MPTESPISARRAHREAEDRAAKWRFARAVERVAVVEAILADYATSYCGRPLRRREIAPLESAVEVASVTWSIEGDVMVEYLHNDDGPGRLIVHEFALLAVIKKQLAIATRHDRVPGVVMDGRLSGTTVVVIGGSSGIGLATARAALDAGAEVVVITGRSNERLDAAAGVLDGRARTAALDSADEAATRELFESLDVVNHIFVSAGAVGPGALTANTEQLRPLLETRVWGSVFAAKYGASRMSAGGSITFCSGVSSIRPRPGGSSVSSASAAAVEALARSLALELAPIRVNVIVPGLVDTPLVEGMFGERHDDAMQAVGKSLPVGRVGQPEDIADAILFLMGNGYVTGTTLVIDGGRLLV